MRWIEMMEKGEVVSLLKEESHTIKSENPIKETLVIGTETTVGKEGNLIEILRVVKEIVESPEKRDSNKKTAEKRFFYYRIILITQF
jgi:hypothetical protein